MTNNNNLNNYISTYPIESYLNEKNNNNNNLNYQNNKNVILSPINVSNDEKFNINYINKELSNKNEKNNSNNENNHKNTFYKKDSNNKMFLVTQEPIKNNVEKEEKNQIVDDKIKEGISPNNILHSLNINEQNNKDDTYKKNFSNNNIIVDKDNVNNLYNLSKNLNEYNQPKYNDNLGINNINSSSQYSLLSFENPYFIDIKNIYNNVFQGQEANNLGQLMNQSNENFFRSCLSINGIYSSQNFYPNINNNNYININENNNNNNINCLNINQKLSENPIQNNQINTKKDDNFENNNLKVEENNSENINNNSIKDNNS